MRDTAKAIDFYKKAFGAREVFRMPGPEGKIVHAELEVGDSILMLCDDLPDVAVSPQTLAGASVTIHLYVKDAEKVFQDALQAGAIVVMPLADMFWGDRYGKLTDPFGHHWSVATHLKDLSPEEMQKAAGAAMPAKLKSGE